MKISEIPIPMTGFKVDIVIGGSKDDYSMLQQKRYGFTKEEADDSSENECCTMRSGKDSELKGEIRFLLKLKVMPKRNLPVFIHELWHLMWHISNVITDFKLNKETQTWAANMFESLFEGVMGAEYREYTESNNIKTS